MPWQLQLQESQPLNIVRLCIRSATPVTQDRPHTALYQGIDAVLKDLVASPEAVLVASCHAHSIAFVVV